MQHRSIPCLFITTLAVLLAAAAPAQSLWHGKERQLHYRTQGTDLIKVQGHNRFNRALYGGNTGFRVEAGDLPELALYLPGMGGNLSFTIIHGKQQKPLNDATIETVYRAGSMIYTVRDPLLGKGYIVLTVLALMEEEGLLLRIEQKGIPAGIQLGITYGGLTGKKFSRDGDIGADPESSFYLKPEYCTGNRYNINSNAFLLQQTVKKDTVAVKGIFPENAQLSVAQFENPDRPYLQARLGLNTRESCYLLVAPATKNTVRNYKELAGLFLKTEQQRQRLASRIKMETPDSFVNAIGGIMAIAADAIYEQPSYLHGAIAWRMRLNAWRGAYCADPLGWHDRARSHFSSYALSQVTEPADGPVVADTALGMARQLEKMGTSMFSEGYICRNPNGDIRPHHYDMNLVFIDQLVRHFSWTGDTAYLRQMWPLLQRHLAWEKRNFDADDDGLYDAYACIWASDALQYNGGAVTHSSAYNYKANKAAAQFARILNENATPYETEAEKIHNAIRLALWLPHLGSYAEYRDNTGSRNLHPAAGLWTIYHALDSEVPDLFDAIQSLSYIDHSIPHIPVAAQGLRDTGLYVLSTTNWQPYTWSINNVALAENLHTALAYWQGNRSGSAFTLWKNSLVESMLLGTSPGNFQQLSFYDAIRGELYRDFADPVGMAARSLVEGLWGIQPRMLDDTLTIKPGWPADWGHASVQLPDIGMRFSRNGLTDKYIIKPAFARQLNLELVLAMPCAGVEAVLVNGKKADYTYSAAIGHPELRICVPRMQQYEVSIRWKNDRLAVLAVPAEAMAGADVSGNLKGGSLLKIYDPQQVLSQSNIHSGGFTGTVAAMEKEYGTFFALVQQGALSWWQPVTLQIKKPEMPAETDLHATKLEMVPLEAYFNDQVTHIFQNKYLSPRWPYPTLQLPVQGIGNWCYPKVMPDIDDSGLRKLAGASGTIQLPGGLQFRTPSAPVANNIVFASLWDNYPDKVDIPVKGKGKALALMLCGTTNPMQSQLENGRITVTYTDGTTTVLPLRNPDNWWPIEQDYYEDGYAFHLPAKPPVRIHLKDGRVFNGFAPEESYSSLKGFSNRMIPGGAATLLQLRLTQGKELRSVTVQATASEVVIGLMAMSIIQETE